MMATEPKVILRRGSRMFGEAARRIDAGERSTEVATLLRDSMPVLRSAMNHLEDTPDFETAHRRLDQVGELARRHFPAGCQFDIEDGRYFQRCPVALAHNRSGFSIEYIVRESECSICGLDPEDCDHIRGLAYDGEDCFTIIKKADMIGVALVGRPAFPDARVEEADVTPEVLASQPGPPFEPGVTPATCNNCLSACTGVSRPFEKSSHSRIVEQSDDLS